MKPSLSTLTGLVLAAGAGTRIGTPKVLLSTPAGDPWLLRAVRLLREAGCEHVVVALGAAVDEPAALLADDGRASVVVVPDWDLGMSASLRAGLDAVAAVTPDAVAVLLTLVDLPDLPLAAVQRVVDHADATPLSLRQASYGGRPGHPALIGRAHWAAIHEEVRGDHGARRYLVEHGVERVECGDLFDGHDVDAAPGPEPWPEPEREPAPRPGRTSRPAQ